MQFEPEESLIHKVTVWIVQIAVVISFAYVLFYAFGTQITNPGQSMRPVLSDGDVLLLDRASFPIAGPKRYDLVLFASPETGTVNIKRIIALPGETVQIRSGEVLVNGDPLPDLPDEALGLASIPGRAEREITLPEDEYFLMGDNRDVSEDSRFESIGNIPRQEMKGRIWFRISPLGSFGPVR